YALASCRASTSNVGAAPGEAHGHLQSLRLGRESGRARRQSLRHDQAPARGNAAARARPRSPGLQPALVLQGRGPPAGADSQRHHGALARGERAAAPPHLAASAAPTPAQALARRPHPIVLAVRLAHGQPHPVDHYALGPADGALASGLALRSPGSLARVVGGAAIVAAATLFAVCGAAGLAAL